MRMKLLALLAAAVLLSPALALAQIGQTATLTGTVTDPSGAVLPGVTVTVTERGGDWGVADRRYGRERHVPFPALPPGTYTVTVELSGFKPFTQEARLQLGQTITVDAKLEVGGLSRDHRRSPARRRSSTSSPLRPRSTSTTRCSRTFHSPAVRSRRDADRARRESEQLQRVRQRRLVVERLPDRRRRRQRSRGGTIWVFANHNWIQEVQVIGLGATADTAGSPASRPTACSAPAATSSRVCSRPCTRTTG